MPIKPLIILAQKAEDGGLFSKMKDGRAGRLRGSMLDLKTIFRARKYTRRILNSLGKNDEEFLIDERIFQIAEIGRIHAKAA
ncbi:MAG: hypothetical protein WCI11_21430 [Candidatus Methylumidiphilus sp.]